MNKSIIIILILAMITIVLVLDTVSVNNTNGILMKHKGQFYCYNENTTSKAEVLKEKERNSIGETIYQNDLLSYFAKDNLTMAEELCNGMAAKGDFPRDNQGEDLELEGTLTLELK